jgi:hypothetical protein
MNTPTPTDPDDDTKRSSPPNINLALKIWMAFVATLAALAGLYTALHQQPPTQEQVNQFVDQTKTIIHQTVIMPPPRRP